MTVNMEGHLSSDVALFVDDQLPMAESARAAAHLAECAACRERRDRFVFAATALRELPLVAAPASIWTSIETALADNAPAFAPSRVERIRTTWASPRNALALAALVVLAVTAAVLLQRAQQPAPWEVVRLDTPGTDSRVSIGEWIETGSSSRAMIKIGTIGTVEIAPNSRMQVLVAREDEHRLNLAYGEVSAQILAPPRLFFVETPASTVVDLGCAYTMQVDDAGTGVLRVTSGWASLEWAGLESLVPAGASCPTRAQVGPGTPSFDDATDGLKAALLAFDFEGGGDGAVDIVLAEARDRDTLTLWHLLSRVEAGDRARIFDRMVQLTPLPAGVTRGQALALDRETLKRWREELAWTW